MRNFGCRPSGVASSTRRQILAAVGLAVTLKCIPFPPIMAEQEEYIEDAVAHRLAHEEIGGPAAAQLLVQEGPPALVVTWPDSSPPVAPDGAAADDDGASGVRHGCARCPRADFLGTSGDQRPHLGTQVRPAQLGA